MATENKRVVAYLSDNEHAKLEELSGVWGLSLSKAIARLILESGGQSTVTVTPQPSGLTEQKVNTLIDAKIDTLVSDKVATLEMAIAALTEKVESLETLRDGQKEVDYAFGIKQCNSLKSDVEIFDKRLSAIESRLIGGELMQRLVPGSPVNAPEMSKPSQHNEPEPTQLAPQGDGAKTEPVQDGDSHSEPVDPNSGLTKKQFSEWSGYSNNSLNKLASDSTTQAVTTGKIGDKESPQFCYVKELRLWFPVGLCKYINKENGWSLSKNTPPKTPLEPTKPTPPVQNIINDDDAPKQADTEKKPSLRELELMSRRAGRGYEV